ncbi:MAG: hypothetical protein IT362_04130 [Deltaproteobacteria bacterium]|nr:hypothetical protein [Deltaproteobacteria bacterium]
MKERAAVERLIKRIYDERLKRTGKTPDAREARDIERKAKETAEAADNRKKRK